MLRYKISVQPRQPARLKAFIALAALGGLSAACAQSAAGGARSRNPEPARELQCRRYVVPPEGPYHLALAEPFDAPILVQVPAEARRVARAAGLEPLIAQLLEARAPGAPASLSELALRQEISMRLEAFEAQLRSLLSEVECTDDMLEQRGEELGQREDARELRLTISSLLLGAVAASASGAWQLAKNDSKGAIAVGIGGGALSAGLGVAALIPRRHVTQLEHAHNLLAPIAKGEDPKRSYPSAVFRWLTLPRADDTGSARQELLTTFEAHLREGRPQPEERSAAAALLFGAGGVYDQALVSLRERLFDELETKLDELVRELELLNRYLITLL